MKRALVLPVSAAALGIFMALGVFALKRAVVNAWEDQTFQVRIDGPRHVVVDGAELRLQGETLREVLEQVSREVREAVEADRELTEAERAEVEAALQRMEAKLGRVRALDAITLPGSPEAPEAPEGAAAPEAPGEPSGN